jgi:multidrug efflux system membrane fusion protein
MSTIHFRPRSIAAAVASVAAVVLVGLWALNHNVRAADPAPADRAPPAIAATTVQVQLRDVPIFRSGIGTAAATQSVTVKARVDGQLDSVGFTEGQDVKAGQVIARLDPRTLRAQLEQVQAQKAKDEAQLNNARVDLRRYKQLIVEEASTQQQLDTQQALVAQLEAAVKNDDAQINYAQVQLGFTTITAPIGGRVGARLVDPGNIVHATDANGLVVINQIDPISVVFTLPEEAFQDINKALHESREPLVVQAFPRNGNELIGTGKLVLLNNQIDTTSGTVQLKASFANPNHTLWPGQYVNVRLMLGRRSKALTIPAAAVQRSQDGTYVYAVDADGKTVHTQSIDLTQIQDGVAIVAKGLSEGQRVVLDGQYKLKPGATIVEASRKGPAPASAAVIAERDAQK